MIQDERDDDYLGVKKMLGEKSKFIPLILQLIVCEDSYYWWINKVLILYDCLIYAFLSRDSIDYLLAVEVLRIDLFFELFILQRPYFP